VTVQRASEAAAEVAASNMPFLPGDRVWTDDAGRMEVQFADGSILRLDSRSKLDYLAQEAGRKERVILRLWSGALILHVRDQRRSPDFVIETPEGVMEPSERGVYRLDVGPGEARVLVLDGEASVDAGRRVELDRGQQLIVREGEPYGGPEPIAGYDADDAFARWDRDLEERLAYADGRREEWLPEEVQPYGSDFAAYGTWRTEPQYGYVWYPRVAAGWRPYSSGHWGWTAYGWTWIPNEPWGWAPSHYGRWGFDGAWYWIPGRSWGPAWVNWSVGGGHIGWCPLGAGDRPVYVRSQEYAVRRGGGRADTVSSPWTYVRGADMGKRDLARRRVDAAQVSTGLLRTVPGATSRLSRDLRIVEGRQPVDLAVPRNVRVRRPVPRRQRDAEERADTSPGDAEEQAAPRATVPRGPRTTAPSMPVAIAPPQQQSPGDSQTGSGQEPRARDTRVRPRSQDDAARRDRDVLRQIFGPLSRPRSNEGAAQDRGGSRRDGGAPPGGARPGWDQARPERSAPRGGSESGGSRPSPGASSSKGSTAPPPAKAPAQQQAQPRERARPRDRDQ
jgi:hypothetical protein